MGQLAKLVAAHAAIALIGLSIASADAEEPLPDFMAPAPESNSNEQQPQSERDQSNGKKSGTPVQEPNEPSAAKMLFTRRLLPRGSGVGLLEGTVAAGLDGLKWQSSTPEPMHVEARVGLHLLLLPFGNANFGAYFNTEFGFPLRNLSDFLQSIRSNNESNTSITDISINEAQILSNHFDLSGGLHARLFGFGSGDIWRGLFLSFGYRGSVWGMQDHGFEAGFGVELWKIRAGGSWYHSMSGPFKDIGGEFFGVRLEWRFLTAFRGVGI